MSHFSISKWLQPQAVMLSMLVAALGFASDAAAVLYDLNVANGNYNVATSWIDHSMGNSGVPGELDAGLVRNGGTLNITAAGGDNTTYVIRVGAGSQTDINALEGVDPTPPPTYGGAGTLNWTGGNILGNVTNSVGPRLAVGQYDNTTNTEYAGIVNQSGGKISLTTSNSFLTIGANGATSTPTSVYNLMPGGTIGMFHAAGGNSGINVRNGTFNMTGGNIMSDEGVNGDQRAITVADASGTGLGTEAVAYANFSGGTVDVNGGMRVANRANSKGYVTISGAADLHFRIDVQVGVNATNSTGQVDMSGGTLSLGDLLAGIQRRLIVGDQGKGVFNLSGGTVNLNHSLVVGNNATSNGTFYQTGGSLTVRDIEMNRNSGIWDPLTENAAIVIDGPSAVFTQVNTTPTLVGQTTIGQFGNGRFEVKQGLADLQVVEISNQPQSRATLKVSGGKLIIHDGMIRNSVTNDGTNNNTPNMVFTGGELELQPAGTAISWNTDLPLNGSRFDPKPGAVMLTNVGSFPNKPANFSLNAGSVWDLNIGSNTLVGGADWVDVPNGAGALNGGMLNIIPISGYTPADGDTVRILSSLSGTGVTMNAAAISVSDPHWQLQLDTPNRSINLKYFATIASIPGDYDNNGAVDARDYVLWRKTPSAYGGTPGGYNTWRTNFGRPPGSGSSLTGSAVPEPTSIVLVGLFASALLTWRRGSRRVEC